MKMIKRMAIFLSVMLLAIGLLCNPAYSARDYFHTGLDVSRSQLKSLIDGWNGALGFAGGESVVALDGTTYYVNSNNPTQGDGSTWDKSFKTITKALTVAIMENDVIIVAPGSYAEGATLNVTTRGLTIKGSDPSGGWQNRATIYDTDAGFHLMAINANNVTIQGLGFSFDASGDTYDAIQIATTDNSYKVTIKNCRFDGWGGEIAINADQTFDAPDLAILNNEFRSWQTASIRVNATRALVAGNIITIGAASTSGIVHVPTGGSRPDTTLIGNTIYGLYSDDTGIEIVGTPSERYFHMSGNHVVACYFPVTLSKYTNWYVGNFWGKEDWRFDPDTGREAAIARGADGNIFYMDLNMAVTGLDGRCWASAFNTIAAAITAADNDSDSNGLGAAGHRNWARRNTIYVIGDEIHEDITILAEKTDIVGLGTDYSSFPRFMHSWDIATGVKGARFFNVGFYNDNADIGFTLPTGSGGTQFHNCHFESGEVGTIGLQVTTSHQVKIKNCEFFGTSGVKYTTAAINIVGNCINLEIDGNYIEGATGIVSNGAGNWGYRISNNIIKASTLTINDTGDVACVTGNHLVSIAAAGGAAAPGAIVASIRTAAGNYLGTLDSSGPWPNVSAHD